MYCLFESYVILNTTKTGRQAELFEAVFESYVILNTTKTTFLFAICHLLFESYVILDTTKTESIDELESAKLSIDKLLYVWQNIVYGLYK